jgi:hypothetical protein
MEAKQLSSNSHFVSNFMNNYDCKIVDCSTTGGGRAGGLVLLWNNCNFTLEIKSYDLNYIDVLINYNNLSWRATGIYGFSNKTQKFQTCQLINDLSHMNNHPNWLIFGDFNIILNSDEKEGAIIWIIISQTALGT